jgi:Transposase protein
LLISVRQAAEREIKTTILETNTVPNTYLTHYELCLKADMLQQKKRIATQTNLRSAIQYKRKLQKAIKVQPDDTVLQVVNTMKCDSELQNNVKNLFIEKFSMISKGAEVTNDIEEQCSAYAKVFIDSLNNSVLRMCNKSKRCRYSEETIRVAMLLFLKSRRTYEQLRNSDFVMFPSVRTLQQYCRGNKTKSGCSPEVYLKHVRHLKSPDRNCVLLFDEMKVKGGLVFRCTDHSLSGLSDDELN